MNKTADILIVGAGASGCMAALSAAELCGGHVVLLEGQDKPARKIYATGNGRCNLTNLDQKENAWHCLPEERPVLDGVLNAWSNEDMMDWFETHGILLHHRDGYVYPRTDQASTVAVFLEKELAHTKVALHTGEKVRSIETVQSDGDSREDALFRILTDHSLWEARRVILACGGAAGPQYGCDGSGFRMAASLGHTVRQPLPALVPLCCKPDPGRRQAAGIRCQAGIRLSTDGKEAGREEGEILFTEYGLSGIPVLQLSGTAARALQSGLQTHLSVDLLHNLSEAQWAREKERRLRSAGENSRQTLGEWLLGLVPDRLQSLILQRFGLVREKKVYKTPPEILPDILESLRTLSMEVTGTQDLSRAQTTTGGIPLCEVREDLSSRVTQGLYLTGEMLDADGLCGGYNLRWAFTTGRIAGLAAGKAVL